MKWSVRDKEKEWKKEEKKEIVKGLCVEPTLYNGLMGLVESR